MSLKNRQKASAAMTSSSLDQMQQQNGGGTSIDSKNSANSSLTTTTIDQTGSTATSLSSATSTSPSTNNTATTPKRPKPLLFRRAYSTGPPPVTPQWVYWILVSIIVITIGTIPHPLHLGPNQIPTIQHVFYYGWLTCISTGLGAVPFYIFPDVAAFWIGISNAIAAGMMIAASYSLFVEGCTYDDGSTPLSKTTTTLQADATTATSIGFLLMGLWNSSYFRTVLGTILGLSFIVVTKSFLDQYDDLKFGVLYGTDAKKAILIFFVMTLHSFSEGVGVGVSFGGVHGKELGIFISTSLAVHNIPEGLAISVSLIGRGISITTAVVYAILTSLPQPFMAVPAYLFVNTFIPLLPIGLGFAGGAMAYVAFFELLMEAIEDTNMIATALVTVPSCIVMLAAQYALK